MTDQLARDFAERQIEMTMSDLKRDSERLARAATFYAEAVTRGEKYSGDARRLAQEAADLAQLATRLDAIVETASYLTNTT